MDISEFNEAGFYDIFTLADNAVRLFGVTPALARAALEEDGKPPYSVIEAADIIDNYKNRRVDVPEDEQPSVKPRIITQRIFTSEDKTKLDTMWDNQQQLTEDFTQADLIRVFVDDPVAEEESDTDTDSDCVIDSDSDSDSEGE